MPKQRNLKKVQTNREIIKKVLIFFNKRLHQNNLFFRITKYRGVMREYLEKNLKNLKPINPPEDLFKKIILAIRKEEKLKKRRNFLIRFSFLLTLSIVSLTFSGKLLMNEIKNSGIIYYFSVLIENLNIFFKIWQNFSLAILESLPVTVITIFIANIIIFLFTIRLFLLKIKMLLG